MPQSPEREAPSVAGSDHQDGGKDERRNQAIHAGMTTMQWRQGVRVDHEFDSIVRIPKHRPRSAMRILELMA
jgi:hypothetical protein